MSDHFSLFVDDEKGLLLSLDGIEKANERFATFRKEKKNVRFDLLPSAAIDRIHDSERL